MLKIPSIIATTIQATIDPSDDYESTWEDPYYSEDDEDDEDSGNIEEDEDE